MSAYNKGSENINLLLETLSQQANRINDYNEKANTALDKELRDIMISYRDGEIKSIAETIKLLQTTMPEFKRHLDDNFKNPMDIGIGDLK